MTPQVTADAAGRHPQELASALRRRSIGRIVARTASYNVASVAAAGLGSIIVARALGPEMRSEYAAVTAWFGVVFIVGTMGQPGALCFYVAHDPGNARGYVATSRAMMLVTGIAALAGGILLAPLLARGNAGLTVAYRIAFAASIVAFVGTSYTFSLQATNLRWWNTVRVSQPVLSVAFLVVLWRLRMLTLNAALTVLALTLLLQLGWCQLPMPVRRPGARPRSSPADPAPCSVRRVPDCGRDPGYPQRQPRPARSLPGRGSGSPRPVCDRSLVHPAPDPARVGDGEGRLSLAGLERARGELGPCRMQWLGILGSACAAAAALVPLNLVAPWVIPRVFGPGYAAVVPLLWALTPAGVFLACNAVTGGHLSGQEAPGGRGQGLKGWRPYSR